MYTLRTGDGSARRTSDFLSAGTVKKHLEHVYRKLGVSNATSAVAQAYNHLASM